MPLRGITSKLQKRDLDIYEAFCDVESVVKDVEIIRIEALIRDMKVGTKKFFIYYEMHWRRRRTTSSSCTAAEQIQSPSK